MDPNSDGQSIPGVMGKVVEAVTQEPVQFATIALFLLPDSTLSGSTTGDSNGYFLIKIPVQAHYFLEVSIPGFETTKTQPFEFNPEAGFDAGNISIEVSSLFLDEIEIYAGNPAYVNGIDRKVYYPKNDVQAQSGSASDVLQNIPSITIDPEGAIQFRGSENIKYLLNGKPSALLKNNPALILEQLPANTIERIEIISNPSARYKPDGVSGIINIVTKKTILTGIHGTLIGNAGTQDRYNGSLNVNFNPGKINISALYGYNQNYNLRTLQDSRIADDSFSMGETMFNLTSTREGRPHSNTATLDLDYNPDEKNSLGVSFNYFHLDINRKEEAFTLESSSSGVINDFTTQKDEADREKEMTLSAYVEHNFKKEDHAISLEMEYGRSDELEDSGYSDSYQFPAYPLSMGHNNLSKIEYGTTLTVNYTNPLSEDYELEAGYDGEYALGDLDFFSENFNSLDNVWKTDLLKTNQFLYKQGIHALYSTISWSFENFGIVLGLRAEQSIIHSNLVTVDSMIQTEYFNLFPTLHFSYELNDEQEIGLSYSRRVNRPDPDELNPFPEYIDIRNIEAGNPFLKPEKVHSVELGYQIQKGRNSFLSTLYYRQTYDAFTEETHYINDSTLLTTLENLSLEQSGGLELIYSWSPSTKANINLSSNLFYQKIDATDLGYDEPKSSVAVDTKLAAFLNISKTTKLQFNTTYRSAMLTAQGRSLPLYFLNAGIKQELFHKKASIVLTMSDVFNTIRWQYIIDTPLLYQKSIRKRKSQIVYLGFSYNFGISPKKRNEELIFDDKL